MYNIGFKVVNVAKVPVFKCQTIFDNFYIYYDFFTIQMNITTKSPEKVRILHKSSKFCHYRSPGPMVRNAKFSFAHAAYSAIMGPWIF